MQVMRYRDVGHQIGFTIPGFSVRLDALYESNARKKERNL